MRKAFLHLWGPDQTGFFLLCFQAGDYFPITGNELAVVSCFAQECRQLFRGCWFGPVQQQVHIGVDHLYSILGYLVSQIVHLAAKEETLGRGYLEAAPSVSLQHLLQHPHVLLDGVGVDNDVVYVGQHVANIDASQDHFHQPRICLWGVAEPERHSDKLKLPEGADERGERSILLTDGDIVVSSSSIQCREDGTLTQLVQVGRDERQRIAILDGYLIEFPKIDAPPQPAVLFPHRDQWSSPRGIRWFSDSLPIPLLKGVPQILLFFGVGW